MSTQNAVRKSTQKQPKDVQSLKIAKTQKATEEAKKEALLKVVVPSADDRIKRMENFQIVTKKYQHLKTKNEELKKFNISSDGTRERLILHNAADFNFEVTNSQVMQKVVNLLQSELDILLVDSEKEVREFEV